MFYPKIEPEVKVNEEPKLELELPFKEDAELDREIDDGSIPHIQEILSDGANGGVKLGVVDIIQAEENCGVSRTDPVDDIYKTHAEMRKRGIIVYPEVWDGLEAIWNRHVEACAHDGASKIAPIPEVYQPTGRPDINLVHPPEFIKMMTAPHEGNLEDILSGGFKIGELPILVAVDDQTNKSKILIAAKRRYLESRTDNHLQTSAWGMHLYTNVLDYFTSGVGVENIKDIDILLNELPGIDITTLPKLIPNKLVNKDFYICYQNSAKWYKSRNILRVAKATSDEVQVCGKIDKSWERLLVACSLIAQQHPLAGKQPTFSMLYGKPTPLGVEILLEACVELTGGPDALFKWLEPLVGGPFNASPLLILLSIYYGIPLKIMEIVVGGMHFCKDLSELIKYPRWCNLITLTGVKDGGLVDVEYNTTSNITTGDNNVN